MLPPLIAKGDPGIDRPIVIDGEVLSILPSQIEFTPEPVSDYQDMLDGGAREWQRRPHFDGVADYSDRYTFSFPYEQLKRTDREILELVRVSGGIHRIVLWRMVPIVYTCKSGVQRYYLPRLRKCAAHLYSGLDLLDGSTVDTDQFPTVATLNGDELDITYALGPTLDDPGAGGLVIAKQPDIAGGALDYTAFRLGDAVATGDRVMLWMALSFEVSMRAPRIVLHGTAENQAHTFVEV